jgi:secreted PhoX family phosphatase
MREASSHFDDVSSPDGLWFSRASGLLWIETDDGTYTDVTNCMLLAALRSRPTSAKPLANSEAQRRSPAASPDGGTIGV